MHDHTVVEHRDSGVGAGAVLGIVLVALIAVMALFFVLGGPGRFAGPTTQQPSNTNVNVPAQQPPQSQSAPNINVPRQIDVNVNQQPGQQAPAQQAPANNGR